MFRILLVILLCLFNYNVFSQRILKINDFISNSGNSNEHSKKNLEEKINKDEDDLFYKGFLPKISLNFTFPNYNRSISEITQPDGTYAFRESNSASSRVNLSVSQKIPFTGGNITISNSLNRLDLFGGSKNTTSYSASWLGISLSQPISFFNSMKWDKKIQDAKFEYNNIMNAKDSYSIKKNATRYYFELLKIKNEKYIIAKKIEATNKYKMHVLSLIKAGRTISHDSIDIELKLISEQKNLRFLDKIENLKIESINSFFNNNHYNKLDSLEIPEININLKELSFYVSKYLDVYQVVERNNLTALQKNIKQFESNKYYSANLSIGAGFNNTSDVYNDIYKTPNKSQNFSISLNVPLLDFGKKRTELNIARNQHDIEILNLENEKRSSIERISILYEEINDLLSGLKIEKSRIDLLKLKLAKIRILLYAQKILFQDYLVTEDRLFNSLNEKVNLTENIFSKIIELEELTLTKILQNEN